MNQTAPMTQLEHETGQPVLWSAPIVGRLHVRGAARGQRWNPAQRDELWARWRRGELRELDFDGHRLSHRPQRQPCALCAGRVADVRRQLRRAALSCGTTTRATSAAATAR